MRTKRVALSSSWQRYVIKRGQHYSRKPDALFSFPHGLYFSPKILKFDVVFSDGCDYILQGVDKYDINKLYGISYGFQSHWNSIRLGWRYNGFDISIFRYSYNLGKREWKQLMTIPLYEEIHCKIFCKDRQGFVQVTHGKNTAHDHFKFDGRSWIRFKLFPYFGGNQRAPKNMRIFIRDEK